LRSDLDWLFSKQELDDGASGDKPIL